MLRCGTWREFFEFSYSYLVVQGNFRQQTRPRMGYSSDSSIWTTWSIFGLFSESTSKHLKTFKRALLRVVVDELFILFRSSTSSDYLLSTIMFSQTTKLTYRNYYEHNFSDAHDNGQSFHFSDKLSCCIKVPLE